MPGRVFGSGVIAPLTSEGHHRLDRCLDAYFATLRSSSLAVSLKRGAGRWQFYASVTSSAIAMATGASAADIQNGPTNTAPAPFASAMPSQQYLAKSGNIQLVNAARAAAAKRNPGTAFAGGLRARVGHLSQSTAPVIAPGGIVPLYSKSNAIQSGEWVSIYGDNLAATTAIWNNDFPTSLAGTTVEIDGKPAYLLFVSPNQINLQVPDDTATGTVPVTVTTDKGSAAATVTMSQFAPSFTLVDTKHVSGIILRPNGSGAYGGGTYDILGPTGKSLGYPTVAAKAGDSVVLFALGLGPTTPSVPAGRDYTGQAPVNDTLSLYINNALVKTTFAGLSGAGLYQINVTIPSGLGTGDVPLRAMIGGLQTQAGAMIPLEDPPINYGGGFGTVYVPVAGSPGAPFMSAFPVSSAGTNENSGGTANGSFGGSGGGAGSGGGSDVRKAPYHPRILFAPRKSTSGS